MITLLKKQAEELKVLLPDIDSDVFQYTFSLLLIFCFHTHSTEFRYSYILVNT